MDRDVPLAASVAPPAPPLLMPPAKDPSERYGGRESRERREMRITAAGHLLDVAAEVLAAHFQEQDENMTAAEARRLIIDSVDLLES